MAKKGIQVHELGIEQKRGPVEMVNKRESYPVSAACEMVELLRSSYYYQSRRKEESELEATIVEIAGKYPTYGTRRVMHQLSRSPCKIIVNRKRV
jgi:hypothetical protein